MENSSFILHLVLLILYFLPFSRFQFRLRFVSADINNHELIFNQCPNRTSPSANPLHSRLLPGLFQEFVARSSEAHFFKTIVGDDELAVSGTFQCKNDLSPDECRRCVRKIESLSEDLCARTLPARIHLSGCYVHYQVDSGDNYDPVQLLHKTCGERVVNKYRFDAMKYKALVALESCVISGNGFCDMNYESLNVVAQCAGNLQRVCDCSGCVSDAVQIAVDECLHSDSAEVYLNSCFVTFHYYKHRGSLLQGKNSTKVVAIVVGALAAVIVLSSLCYCLRSCNKEQK
ncbi:plasmodesmata-located protein 2-like [Andrographis paniculata]|uniref:plasmodesmata-located protein 2-like n=1 Tax=Andrographis paniculata TaxID=175694 RepID=UPI0021E877EA|nr:plasmodesmata-located protein 2-like [Andrographis paniculata]